LTTLSMWQGGNLASFRVFFFSFKKKNCKSKNKSCHGDKDDHKLCIEIVIYHVSY
jgi:hypothetical protein